MRVKVRVAVHRGQGLAGFFTTMSKLEFRFGYRPTI